MLMRPLKALAVAAMLGTATTANAALVVSGSLDGDALVNALLAGGSGISGISNITVIGGAAGTPLQTGTFSGGLSAGLGFDTGVVMTSGNINSLPTPTSGSNDSLERAGDAKLTAIVGGTTNDAAVLSFDFIPDGSQVKFSYVFGSTEYNFYVNSTFNDVFAFFVNDVNRALVPGTSDPVSINTVNCGQADGPTSAGSPGAAPVTNCNQFVNNRVDGSTVGSDLDINLGGFTKTFSFIADVNPDVTNTMYLAIADRSDNALDSAVFIAGGTFSTCGGPDQPPCDGNGTIPEPGSLALLGLGVAAMAMLRRRRLA
jgi:hypothetical protein